MRKNIAKLDIRKTFNSLREPIALLDESRKIIFANDEFCVLFGFDPTEVSGISEEQLLADEKARKEWNKSLGQVAKTGETGNAQMTFRGKNGETFKAEITLIPLAEQDENNLSQLIIFFDPASRRILERKIEETSLLLNEAIEAISEGFALYDRDDELVLCNTNYKRIYSMSEGYIEPGQKFQDILQHGLQRDQYELNGLSKRDWLNKRMERHQRADGEVHEQHLKDGRWLRVSERRTPNGFTAGIRTDITNLKHTQLELQEAYANMALLTDSLNCSIIELDMDGTCIFINDYGAAWYQLSPEQIIGRKFRDFLSPERRTKTTLHYREALSGRRLQIETSDVFPDGTLRDLMVEYIPKFSKDNSMAGVIVVTTDITERKKTDRTLASLYQVTATQELSTQQKIQQILRIGCDHFDLPFGIVSQIIEDSYTVVAAETPSDEVVPGAHFPLGDTYCLHTLGDDKPLAIMHAAKSDIALHPCYKKFQLETYIGVPVFVDGERYGTINFTSPEARSKPFTTTDSQLICQFADWVGHELAREMAKKELVEAKVRQERLASIDDLTEIYNRRAFLERAAMDVAHFRREGRGFAVVVLDIDNFKLINDNHGHATGDVVLKRFAALLEGELRVVDTAGRIGGEEFCLILSNSDEDGAIKVSNRILDKLRGTPLVDTPELNVTCSIGIATVQPGDLEFSAILHRADNALYEAKNQGRNRFCVASTPAKGPASEPHKA